MENFDPTTNFIDYMIFACAAFVIIGTALTIWCWLCEIVIDKMGWRDKIINFFAGEEDETEDEE